jgi:hypothetical protein
VVTPDNPLSFRIYPSLNEKKGLPVGWDNLIYIRIREHILLDGKNRYIHTLNSIYIKKAATNAFPLSKPIMN